MISRRAVLRPRAAELGHPLTVEVSDPDVVVAVDRDSPWDLDATAFVRLCTHWVPVGIEFRDGCVVKIGCQIAVILSCILSGAGHALTAEFEIHTFPRLSMMAKAQVSGATGNAGW